MAGGNPLELIAVEVRADIDQLQNGMSGATRVVDAGYQQINRAAEESERTIARSATTSSDALDKTSNASRQLGFQFSQMGQQIAAGASPLQAIAIQLPDIAVALSTTGAEAGSLAAFFGGPWGIALTTAAAVAASFIPQILGIGDAADGSRPKVDAMADALDRLSKAQGRVTRESFGRAQANLLEKQAAVRQARDYRAVLGNSFAGAGGVAQANQRIRDAQVELGQAADILKLSRIRLGIQDKIDAANSAADAKTGTRAARSSGGSVGRSRGRVVSPAADPAAKLEARQDQLYDKTKAQLELEQRLADLRAQGTESASMTADILEARARIEQQFPELAKSTKDEDQQRLQVLLDIQNAIIGEAYQRKANKDAAEEQKKAAEERQQQAERDIASTQRQQEQQIRTLAGVYQDAFRGGTDAIWKDFKDVGLRVVAEVLARFTLAKISGGSFDLGGALSSAIGSVLPGFASGGSMVIGGRGGTDNNTLALNGRPIARVSAGEHLNIVNPALGRSGGTTIIQQTVQVDARNSVTPDGFAREILAISGQQAQQAAGRMGQAINKGLPSRLSGFQRDGT